jgi:hypothetical protein
MSEYRTPEEDTIGGHSELDDGDENDERPESARPEQERVQPSGQPD